ncbi:uncharacterized protein LOC110991446 [Pieris rapae]|uniref:uncharacterized protein LOC110991446 n=1 Tax=Pieris rapae TaxID=64459 RepID=UPI001E27C8AE|nr:uncharacterized protein LOC110991446 [Pieris rapae]
MIILLLILIIQQSCCNWVSEWLTPLEMQYKEPSENQFLDQNKWSQQNVELSLAKDSQDVMDDLLAVKLKLVSTLKSAKELADTLKKQIGDIEIKERYLKEAIAYGKSGVTTVNVLTTSRDPQTYIIRDGYWYICDGVVQNSIASENIFREISIPKCIGQEIPSIRDPCVFNSIIKFETIPTTRRAIYEEDNFLCLKPNFNLTLEKYQSVPKQVVYDTCKKGSIKSLADNLMSCGTRILADYTYYPNRKLPTDLQEYCTEIDGSCKLIVAWHLSNSSIENHETISNDKAFKRTFLKMGLFKQMKV